MGVEEGRGWWLDKGFGDEAKNVEEMCGAVKEIEAW